MKYSCSVQTQTVYIMEMPQQQRWNSELLWGRLWEYRGRPMRCLPNTLRILKNILMIFCYMRNNIRNIFFLVTEIGCGISKHSPFEIAPLFKEAVHIKNINLPLSFWDVLNGGIQARIKQVAEKESPSVSDFCQRTGLSFTILMNILFRKELPTVWIVRKILIAFPSINVRWLLLGEGDMKLTKRNSFFHKNKRFSAYPFRFQIDVRLLFSHIKNKAVFVSCIVLFSCL